MPDNIPETGDAVIHRSESNATQTYAVYAVPGPDQFGYATRGEAERMARSYAKRSGVNLWFSEGASRFTLLATFRGVAHGQLLRTPSVDGAIGAAANRRPTP